MMFCQEAAWWGTDFILSGSDCGHLFGWQRSTGQCVVMLEADRWLLMLMLLLMLIFLQKHATMNGNALKSSSDFLQHSIWNNLVSSTVPAAAEPGGDEKKKIHKCDFPTCDKIYTKSSHLKAHKR